MYLYIYIYIYQPPCISVSWWVLCCLLPEMIATGCHPWEESERPKGQGQGGNWDYRLCFGRIKCMYPKKYKGISYTMCLNPDMSPAKFLTWSTKNIGPNWYHLQRHNTSGPRPSLGTGYIQRVGNLWDDFCKLSGPRNAEFNLFECNPRNGKHPFFLQKKNIEHYINATIWKRIPQS